MTVSNSDEFEQLTTLHTCAADSPHHPYIFSFQKYTNDQPLALDLHSFRPTTFHAYIYA